MLDRGVPSIGDVNCSNFYTKGRPTVETEIVEADVLCIGGGIAGLMAAIRASEFGAKVVVADKANTLRSGAGTTGNDHIQCYIPEVQAKELDRIKEWSQRTMRAPGFLELWLEKSFEMVKLWDSWGIPMKYKGHYEFAGHAIPGQPLDHLKYEGGNQKKILTKKALGNGVKIINRVMGIDLLRDGGIVGVIGVDTRENKLVVFRAKSVVLGTGVLNRLYPGPTPAWLFNSAFCPACTGDAQAMALRIGAELTGSEQTLRHRGPKYFARCGQATWIGIFKDAKGNPVGPWPTELDRRYSPALLELAPQALEGYAKSGRGPLYLDSAGLSDEDYEYMIHWLRNEGNTGLVNYMAEEGIDTRKNPIEFMFYPPFGGSSIRINVRSETSVKGLYAAGDNASGIAAMAGAAIEGWVAGESAANYAKETGLSNINRVEGTIEEKRRLLEQIQGREVGASWQEVNIALQQIMNDYVGYAMGLGAGGVISETMLMAGLTYLRRLREKAYATMMARNPHELMRCLEVLDLLDLGELVFIAANERKETRGTFIRSDYPFTDPALDGKRIVLAKEDDKIVTRWEALKR
jgi:succinate dehydrogenase/fumarate reductase flavoprotein subunit